MLEVTSPALEKLKEVIEDQGDAETGLRVIAMPSGNGSVQYMMTAEKDTQQDDIVLEVQGLRFLMDADSVPFLDEATIDYVEELTKVGFVINNPNFASGGGCGSGSCGCGNGGCGCGSGGCGGH